MPRIPRRSALTADQQDHQRAKLMISAGKIISQLDEYITKGHITVAGKERKIDSTRLAAYRMVLDRTVPTISAAEITHKSEYEQLSTDDILAQLAKLASKKPELVSKLHDALGGKVIDGETVQVGSDQPHKSEPQPKPSERGTALEIEQ